MILSQAIEGYFLDYSAKGRSHHTIRNNQVCLKHLQQYFGDPEVQTITPEKLKQFWNWLQHEYVPVRPDKSTAPLSGFSIENHWKALRTFFEWAERELKLPRPDLDIKSPSFTYPEIIPFSKEEVKLLLKAAEKAGKRNRKTGNREVLMIQLLLDTGMRVGELCRLRVQDVNLQNGEIHIRAYLSGLKSRPRTVFMGTHTRRNAWHYLHHRETRPTDPLLITLENKPITENSVRNVLKAIGKSAKIARVHPHRFRHTFAIEYLRNGGDVFTLQRLLGHSSLEMCEQYLHLVRDDLQSAHRRASPVDNL